VSYDQEREWFGGADGDAMLFDAAANRWAPGAPGGGGGGGSGDITAVNVSSPLTGGGTSGDVSIGLGTVPVSKGGTGATTEAAARTALGVAAASHTHVAADVTGFSAWTAFTPTGTHTSATYTGFWRRVNDSIDLQIGIKYTGAPAAAGLTITWHSVLGLTVDTAKITQPLGNASERYPCVTGCAIDFGNSTRLVGGELILSTSLLFVTCVGTAPNTLAQVSATVPFSFGNGDAIWLKATGIPISGW
jgi:hypothetical protein